MNPMIFIYAILAVMFAAMTFVAIEVKATKPQEKLVFLFVSAIGFLGFCLMCVLMAGG